MNSFAVDQPIHQLVALLGVGILEEGQQLIDRRDAAGRIKIGTPRTNSRSDAGPA